MVKSTIVINGIKFSHWKYRLSGSTQKCLKWGHKAPKPNMHRTAQTICFHLCLKNINKAYGKSDGKQIHIKP